jgi:hypothetical protein
MGLSFAPTPTPFISYTRLILFDCSLACVPYIGVVDRDTSLATRTLLRPFTRVFVRRRLHSHSQFLHGGRLLATLSQRLLTFFLKPLHLSVAFNCDISCTRFYLAASFTAARSTRSFTAAATSYSMETLFRRSTPYCCNPSPFKKLS